MPTETPEKIAVTVELPAAVAPHFGADPDPMARHLPEQAAAEGYRSSQLSQGQASQMLGFSWAETEEFLARHNCERHYDLEGLEKDRQNLDQILGPS